MHLTSILLILVVTWRNNFLNLIFHLSITFNRVDKIFTFRQISEEEVLTLLLNMSTNKATGMDQLSIKLAKLAAPLTAHAMTVMFNKLIALGTFPCEWEI